MLRKASSTGRGARHLHQASRNTAAFRGHRLPQDPNQFHDLWEQLTPEEKDWLYQQDHSIGNHGGMPFNDRNHYNRLHLNELQQTNQAEIDWLRAAHPDWARGGTPFLDSKEWQNWKTQ